MTRIGFYSGSFDPVTIGHTDVISRAARLVDMLVIGIGIHPAKAPMFTDAERVAMLEVETRPIAKATGTKFEIVTFDDLAIDAARRHGASAIFRGLRDGTDFDYEMQMAGMNGVMSPDIQTVFVAASPGSATSRLIWCGRWRRWAATCRGSCRQRSPSGCGPKPQSRNSAMAGSPAFADIKADVLAIIAALPRGKVTSPTVIGVRLVSRSRSSQPLAACPGRTSRTTRTLAKRMISRVIQIRKFATRSNRDMNANLRIITPAVMPRHIATILANLDDDERDRVPWYRVVADGGAIGRHRHRDEQIARLRADGLPVSAAGIVGGMEAAMLANLPKPRPGAQARTTSAATRNVDEKSAAADGSDEATVEPPRSSRARGRFDRPATKLR